MNAPVVFPDIAPLVSGSTLLFPVVGNPVSQVKAPLAFNALFRRPGINALVVPLELPPESVVDTCRGLLASNSIGGLLVTVSYKKTLFDLVAQPGDSARLVGPVNAIRRGRTGALQGDLFDGVGFLAGLRAAGHEPSGRRMLVVGAGGAGSAVSAALLMAGVAWLGIFDVDTALAVALAAQLQQRFSASKVVPLRAPMEAAGDRRERYPARHEARRRAPLRLGIAHQRHAGDRRDHAASQHAAAAARGTAPPARAPSRPMLDHQLPAYLDFFGLPQATRMAQASLR